ncbi:MAG: trigger factor [Bacilli bacterium]|nr:trigger factor [Bacilli bacterium]MDD4283158.1 trigger factor [Bacilli bacterium]MDD4718738.1 trigger factor [Bacilli bacterium]
MENKNIKKITIKVEGSEWEHALDHAFEHANANAKIDGFRPGKAPKDVFIKKYGKESLYMEAADHAMNDAYVKMLQENADLELVAQPDIDLSNVDENGVEFVFTLTLKPEVKLGKYKNLGIKKDEVKVTDEEVDNSLNQTLQNYAEISVKEGAIVSGDTAIIDFEGFKDDVVFEGGKGENYSLEIGSNSFIPGFEEQLIGLKKGDTKEVKLSFPEDYHSEELKGQPVVFKVTVNEIKEKVIPELDAEFFEDLGMEGIDSKEALEKQLRENLIARKEVDSENKYIDQLLEESAKTVEVDIPEIMIDEEVTRILGQYEENLKMQGLNLEQFYQFTNSDENALREQMKEEAINRVKYRLMLEEIAKVEKIEITDEKAKEEALKLASKYQMEEEEFLKLFGGIDMIKYDLQMRGAIEVMK